MPALLALVPIKDWVYLSLILALIGGFVSYTIHERHLGAAHEVAALKKSSNTLQAAAVKHNAEIAKAYAASSSKIVGDLNAQLKTASDQHDSDAQRLREYDTYRSAHPAVGSAGSAVGVVAAGNESSNGLDQRLASLEQVALGLATADREVSDSLTACIAERNSLTGKP
jgi:hypothetical protein